MDSSELQAGRPSPRRELLGPRPTPLKVRKDPHKIKKPPVAPPPPQPAAQPLQYRPPVIIYTVSPKVIHTTPGDFMSLVQRLTGASSSSSSAAPRSPSGATTGGEALSPAARLATIEKGAKVQHTSDEERLRKNNGEDVLDKLGIDGDAATLSRHGSFPGILSPIPASLPSISPNFFSPMMEGNPLNFLHELSPAFRGNKNFMENSFLASPNNFLATPVVPSPGAYWDLFNHYQDF